MNGPLVTYDCLLHTHDAEIRCVGLYYAGRRMGRVGSNGETSAIQCGDCAASRTLGRNYRLSSEVVSGRRVKEGGMGEVLHMHNFPGEGGAQD